MDNSKITPGPWGAWQLPYDHKHSEKYIIVSGEEGINEVCSVVWKDADAKLIAAAPDMLEAMQEFCERVEKGEVRSTYTYTKFKELIKKATT